MFRLHFHYYTYHLLDVFKTGFVYSSACLPRVDLSVMCQRSSVKIHQNEVLSLRTLLSDVYRGCTEMCHKADVDLRAAGRVDSASEAV